MMRGGPLLAAFGLLIAAPPPLVAQNLERLGFASTAQVTDAAAGPFWPRAPQAAAMRLTASEARRPRQWPYVAGGATIGALATAGSLAYWFSKNNTECICSPFMFAPVVLGGAALGAGAGYVVYRVRF